MTTRVNPVLLAGPVRGVDGRGWIVRPRAPTLADGRFGDMFFDTVSHFGYGPKDETGWGEGQYLRGPSGWTPLERIVNDGSRRVVEVYDWTGGAGTKPATGFKTATGTLTGTIGSAADVRGAQGPQALINQLGAAGSILALNSLFASAEGSGDNEKRSLAEIFDIGGAMDFRSKAEAEPLTIRSKIKRIRVAGLTYVRAATAAEATAYPAGARMRTFDRFVLAETETTSSVDGGYWVIAETMISGNLPGCTTQETATAVRLSGAMWVMPPGSTATLTVAPGTTSFKDAVDTVAKWIPLNKAKKKIIIPAGDYETSDSIYVDDSFGRHLFMESSTPSEVLTPGFSVGSPWTISMSPVAPYVHPSGPGHPLSAEMGGWEATIPMANTGSLKAGDVAYIRMTTGDDGAGGASYEHAAMRGPVKCRSVVPNTSATFLFTDIRVAWGAGRLFTATIMKPSVQIQWSNMNFDHGSEFYCLFVKQSLGGIRDIAIKGDPGRSNSNGFGIHDGGFLASNYEYPVNTIGLFVIYGQGRNGGYVFRLAVGDMPWLAIGACRVNAANVLLAGHLDAVEAIFSGCGGAGGVGVNGGKLNAGQASAVGCSVGYQANSGSILTCPGALGWGNVSANFQANTGGQIWAEGSTLRPTVSGRAPTLFRAQRGGQIYVNSDTVLLFAGVGGEYSPPLGKLGNGNAFIGPVTFDSTRQEIVGLGRDAWRTVYTIPAITNGSRGSLVVARAGKGITAASPSSVHILYPNGPLPIGLVAWPPTPETDQLRVYIDNRSGADYAGGSFTLGFEVNFN